jgi:Raf kinase inhibitor-like YbhB/YbcL family protein
MQARTVWLALAALLTACGRDEPARPVPAIALTSPAFAAGEPIPREYTCDGANHSSPLEWRGAPAGTKSFALVMEDPDAPGGTFRHWGVYDLPFDRDLLEAAAVGLKQARNDFGQAGYGGPCPPPAGGLHHYHFRLFALDVASLGPAPGDVKAIADEAEGHIVGEGELVGVYGR